MKDSGSSSKGGGTGDRVVTTSRLPYPYVPLSPDSRPLARGTRHWHDWHSRHTCTCVMPSHDLWLRDLWCKRLGKISNLNGSNAVFFLSRVRIFVFWLFSHIKFCFKPRRTLNGSCWVRFFDWMINKSFPFRISLLHTVVVEIPLPTLSSPGLLPPRPPPPLPVK